jgi:hypothetical protein
MSNEVILREFVQKVWNEKDVDTIASFVDNAYTIHLDTGDLWEGSFLMH